MMETHMEPILSWSGAITNEEIYNIARDPSNSRYRWAMDQILNYDHIERIRALSTSLSSQGESSSTSAV